MEKCWAVEHRLPAFPENGPGQAENAMEAKCDFKCRGGTLIIRRLQLPFATYFKPWAISSRCQSVFERGCLNSVFKKRASMNATRSLAINLQADHVSRETVPSAVSPDHHIFAETFARFHEYLLIHFAEGYSEGRAASARASIPAIRSMNLQHKFWVPSR